MTAKFFLKEISGLKPEEALLLKDALMEKYKNKTSTNAYHDKIKQIAFNLSKCGKSRPQVKNKAKAIEFVNYTDQQWLQLLPQKEAPTTSSRALLRNLLSIDTLDDEGLSAHAPLNICRKCGGSDVAFDSQQTRSIDEAATIFFFCLNPLCLAQWTV